MTGGPLTGALLAGVAGVGLALIGSAVRPVDLGPSRRWVGRRAAARVWAGLGRRRRRVIVAAAVGVAGAGLTGWPVVAVLCAGAVWVLPEVARPDQAGRRETDRVEAVAAWAEMLRDILSAAAGLEQAITATAEVAPAAVAGPVRALAVRLRTGWPLPAALREFADEAADPTADLVAAALLLAAEYPASDLAGLLGALAAAAREQAGMRLRVAAGRARTATAVRTVIGSTFALTAALSVFNRGYLTAYATPAGQLVLLLIGGLFALGLAWLRRLARIAPPARLLTRSPAAGLEVA